MQGFWNALIYMRPYYETYSKQKKKRRSQRKIQQASPDLAAIINTIGKSCPPSMESSDKATGGEVPPNAMEESETTYLNSWMFDQSEKFATQPEEGIGEVPPVEVGRYAQRNPSDLCSRRGKNWSKGEDVHR
jgi:hypothetical protein